MVMIFDSFYEAWTYRLQKILDVGEHVAPRGLATLEDIAASFTVIDALKNVIDHKVRDLNYRFGVAEWFWILAGSARLDLLSQYNKRMEEFSDDGRILSGAYGPRIMAQMPWVIEQLQKSVVTRQAIATVFTPMPGPSRDIPCTLSLQFLLRKQFLHLIVTMRSSDTWFGLPYDFFTFSQIQNWVATAVSTEEVPVGVGSLTMHLGSSHLYEPEWEKAKLLVHSLSLGCSITSPRLPIGRPNTAWLIAALKQRLQLYEDGHWSRYAYLLTRKTRDEAMEVLRDLTAKH